jgi:hypothetical protein
MLGAVSYSEDQMLAILGEPVQGNGLLALADQLIAAKLNAATGATVPAAVANCVTGADSLIGNLVAPPIGTGYLAPNASSALGSCLDQYNNGLAEGGPPHCD